MSVVFDFKDVGEHDEKRESESDDDQQVQNGERHDVAKDISDHRDQWSRRAQRLQIEQDLENSATVTEQRMAAKLTQLQKDMHSTAAMTADASIRGCSPVKMRYNRIAGTVNKETILRARKEGSLCEPSTTGARPYRRDDAEHGEIDDEEDGDGGGQPDERTLLD